MSSLKQVTLDFMHRRLKGPVKTLYRRPVVELARAWRSGPLQASFIGVTGSAGKTTTKDLLLATLAQRHRCVGNSDSNNELYNVARTLLAVRPGTQFCVQELGLDQPNRFSAMLRLLRPHVGIVTTIGAEHFSAFRSLDAIAAEKGQLIESLPPGGLAVLNADDPQVSAMARRTRARVVTFGVRGSADYRAEVLQASWPERLTLRVSHGAESARIDTQFCGAHHAVNVLAAVAAAHSLGASFDDAVAGIGAYEPMLGRLSVQHTRAGITFIRDDLKAPAWSLDAAWQFMREARASRKIVVLGTISDYTQTARSIYRRAVVAAQEVSDQVVLVGEFAPRRAQRWRDLQPGRLHGFETAREAAAWLRTCVQPGDLVLLKGSLGADHLARIAQSLDQAVGCWRRRCPRIIFCDHCRLLRQPAA
jgi:UDP-N-acetylmuramyl pentapeptide synthase